jgi:hypothetical protein
MATAPAITTPTKSGFNASMLSSKQKQQLAKTGQFKSSTGQMRDATGNAAPAVTQDQASKMTLTQLSSALASPVTSPTPATAVTPAPTINLPEPTALDVQTANVGTVQGAVDAARANLNTVTTNQQKRIDDEIAILEKEQKEILKEGKALTQPFREDLEKKERERLHINENFEANQKLTNELEGLLTESNELINIAMGRQVSGKVLDKSLSRTMADVQGRAGVVEAVMNARNGQIAQAERTIDRTVAAIVADRNDELSYYNTLLDLNNNKLIKLDDESFTLATEARAQATKDLENAEATATYLKSLMINPETASFMADAGVSLTDSIEGIKEKMAKQAKTQEATDVRNQLVADGYEISPVPVAGGVAIDAGGQTIYAKVRPGSELALRLEASKANIAQSYAAARASNASAAASETGRLLELAAAGDPAAISALGLTMPDNTQPSDELIAYASEYAANGSVASLPKHINLGQVAELARSLPKPNGAIVSTNTGVMSKALSADASKGITAMNEIVNDTLPFMMQKWEEVQMTNFGGTGVVGGIASKIIPSKAMTEYETARQEFLSKLLVARSGATVTPQEYARYAALVPDSFNSPFFLGSSGETKLNTLNQLMGTNFDNYLNSNQLSVYGYSKINLDGQDFTVGEVVTNEYGQSGIVQPDGSIGLINP